MAAVVPTREVGFPTGIAAGVTVADEANGAFPVAALLVAGAIGAVAFILADDGNVEGITYRSDSGAGDWRGIWLLVGVAAVVAAVGAVATGLVGAGLAP